MGDPAGAKKSNFGNFLFRWKRNHMQRSFCPPLSREGAEKGTGKKVRALAEGFCVRGARRGTFIPRGGQSRGGKRRAFPKGEKGQKHAVSGAIATV